MVEAISMYCLDIWLVIQLNEEIVAEMQTLYSQPNALVARPNLDYYYLIMLKTRKP